MEITGKRTQTIGKGRNAFGKRRNHSQMGVRFGEKGATPAEKGAIQRAEGHRSTAGVDGTLPGLHGTWQTKSTKPPSKVTLSCPTAPLLSGIPVRQTPVPQKHPRPCTNPGVNALSSRNHCSTSVVCKESAGSAMNHAHNDRFATDV